MGTNAEGKRERFMFSIFRCRTPFEDTDLLNSTRKLISSISDDGCKAGTTNNDLGRAGYSVLSRRTRRLGGPAEKRSERRGEMPAILTDFREVNEERTPERKNADFHTVRILVRAIPLKILKETSPSTGPGGDFWGAH